MPDLIAIRTHERIEAVAPKVAEALGVSLEPHESTHWGDPYYSGWPESEIKLTANLDPMYQEGDPPDERWFSRSVRDAAYLVWDTADAPAPAANLQAAGLDAEVVTDYLRGHSETLAQPSGQSLIAAPSEQSF